jgi:large subunit ribosomal protein L15
MARRLPKVGFTNLFRVEHQVVNVKDLARFSAGSVVDAAALKGAGLVPRADRPVKVLAEGELSQAVTLKVDAISAAARQKVESAGGSVELTPTSARAKRGQTGAPPGGEA